MQLNFGRLPLVLAFSVLLLSGTAGCGGGASSSKETSASGDVPFDRAFIDGMVPHHEAAIAMAKAAKAAGLKEPVLVRIADAIIPTQQQEIDDMRAWREEWFGSAKIDPNGAESLGLTEAEMGMQHDPKAVSEADDVDAAFASMMIDHHRGAINMAQLAQAKGQHEEIRTLADAIISAQQQEIDAMEPHAAGEHSSGGHGG